MGTASQKLEDAGASRGGLFSPILTRVPEVWLRFLLAVFGLVFAFVAALFSTVFRQSGNVWGTLVFGSAALVIATLVGLTTVPYLMRRVAGSRVRNAFNYEVTRIGIAYVLVVLVIGVAALNTGNNLLYIVVAAMLGAIVISGSASALVLKHLELEVDLPTRIFARQPIVARITMSNRRRWIPAFSITLVATHRRRARKQWNWTPHTFVFPRGRPAKEQWLRLPDRKLKRVEGSEASPPIFRDSVYFPFLAAYGKSSVEIELDFERRGRYEQHGFDLRTRFPFAFLTKSRRVKTANEIIVLPSVKLTHKLSKILPNINGELESFMRGQGSSLYRIRDYMPEDPVRHVDWKATAKSGSLMVREFAREQQYDVRIVFDNPPLGTLSPADYEQAVDMAAALSWYFSAESRNISYFSQEYQGSPDIYDFLQFLALVKAGPAASVLENLPLTEEFNIIVTARSREHIPPALLSCSQILSPLEL